MDNWFFYLEEKYLLQLMFKILANKVEQLGSQFEVLSQSLTNKIEENASNILESIK